jgi:hypothetical protein
MESNWLSRAATVMPAAVLVTTLFSGPARAALLFDQPGSLLPGFTSANPNGNDGTGRAVFDDFMLGSDFALSRVEWTGGPVSTGSGPTLTAALVAPPVQFLLSIRPDDGTGHPDDVPLAGLTAGFETIAGTLLSSSGTEDVYRYGFDLPSAINLDANTRYWLQITALFTAAAPNLTWDWSDGSGGNGIGSYYDTTLSTYVNTSGDRSFSLFGDLATSVPEPHSALLLMIGLAAASFASSAGRRSR